MEDKNAGLRTLWLILAVDLVITAIEFGGWFFSKSLLLGSNFFSGNYDAVLVTLNIWGLKQENQGHSRAANRIAWWSDVALATGCLIILILGAHAALKNDEVLTRGWLIPAIGFFAGAVNLACAFAIDAHSSINAQSARLKFYVGSAIGFGTGTNGLVILLFNLPKLDAVISALLALGVILAVIRRLNIQKEQEGLQELSRVSQVLSMRAR